MKKIILLIVFIFLISAFSTAQQAASELPKLTPSPESAMKQTPELCEKLSIFEPFVGKTWIGTIPGDSRMGEISLRWETILDGFAVRLERTIPNHKHTTESIYYWDESLGKMAYLTITNNGYLTTGTVNYREKELISEGFQQGNGIQRQVRRIYKIDKEGKLFEDDLFRGSDNEEWHRTHISIYVVKQ